MYQEIAHHVGTGHITHLLVQAENKTFLSHPQEILNKETIDTCYIDPPYNTGSQTFTYEDKKDTPAWSLFMKERLTPLIPLLKPTGVILVSIDDSEVHTLRTLMDEIFGKKNFIAQLVIDGGNPKNNARFFSISHEYILVYAKNLNQLRKSGITWRKQREGIDTLFSEYSKSKKQHGDDYEKITQHLKKWVKTAPLSTRLKKFYNADEKGLYTYADLSAPGNGPRYDVLHPITQKPCQVPSRGWGYKKESMDSMIAEKMILFGKDETYQPMKKLYLQNKKDQVQNGIMSYPSRTTTHMLEKILGRRSSFSHPKSLNLMMDLIDLVTPDDGIVLDYFAGSGTTGHAVMELNKRDKDSQRTSILVTNNENNIFSDVTYPRLYKVWENWIEKKTASHIDSLRVLSVS